MCVSSSAGLRGGFPTRQVGCPDCRTPLLFLPVKVAVFCWKFWFRWLLLGVYTAAQFGWSSCHCVHHPYRYIVGISLEVLWITKLISCGLGAPAAVLNPAHFKLTLSCDCCVHIILSFEGNGYMAGATVSS